MVTLVVEQIKVKLAWLEKVGCELEHRAPATVVGRGPAFTDLASGAKPSDPEL
jgi:hypothetical protein